MNESTLVLVLFIKAFSHKQETSCDRLLIQVLTSSIQSKTNLQQSWQAIQDSPKLQARLKKLNKNFDQLCELILPMDL